MCLIITHKLTAYGVYRDLFNHDIVKCMRTRRKFKIDFLENKTSNEKHLFHIFDIFSYVQSPPLGCIIILGHPVYNGLFVIKELVTKDRCCVLFHSFSRTDRVVSEWFHRLNYQV